MQKYEGLGKLMSHSWKNMYHIWEKYKKIVYFVLFWHKKRIRMQEMLI